jgi:GAF domain-containing protein
MSDGDLRAAAAAGVIAAEEGHRRLLDAIVEVARAIFSARAASVMLLDEEADELVFAAVAGEGREALVGRGFPASTGVAGWVAVTRQPLVLEDVGADPRFARDVAEGTGYVPKGLMAVPLLDGEETLGVLQVLDRQAEFTLREMELLGLFATQAAVALNLLRHARRARLALDAAGEEAGLVARLAEVVERLPEERRGDGAALLAALVRVLRT